MAQFVKIGPRYLNLDAIAFVREGKREGNVEATIYFSGNTNDDNFLPSIHLSAVEWDHFKLVLDSLDNLPIPIGEVQP